MKLKSQLIVFFVFPLACNVWAQGTVNQSESADISNLPHGISFQWGASPHNSDWTYQYGTKLTVKHSPHRNFEIMTTGRGGDCGTFLSFRVFDADNTNWFPWRRILIANQDGSLALGRNCGVSGYMLTVAGAILAEEVKVSTVPQSDYVFEPDYPLLPLSEVETHIKEKKHLPGIPSAEEFKENGVGLGEMDDMLLRKVEELTLYVIELKKENEEQAKRLEKLEEENSKLKQTIK